MARIWSYAHLSKQQIHILYLLNDHSDTRLSFPSLAIINPSPSFQLSSNTPRPPTAPPIFQLSDESSSTLLFLSFAVLDGE
jgi:hypothetical protein